MFGGHGLFAPNGGMFAAVVDGDRVALKLPRPEDQEAFVAEGAEPWVYEGRTSMGGWFVIPDALYDEPRSLADWARRAHATAAPSRSKVARAKKAAKAAARKGAAKKAPRKRAGAKE